MNWALNDPDFLEKYNAARGIQADRMIDEVLDIADDGTNDWMTRTIRGQEVAMVDNEAIQRSKLRVEARLRIAAKLLPKKYGEKSGEINVHNTVNNVVVLSAERTQQLQDRLKALEGSSIGR